MHLSSWEQYLIYHYITCARYCILAIRQHQVFKYNGVTDDAIRLKLFSFSLKDKAKNWLSSLLASSITTWDSLAQNSYIS